MKSNRSLTFYITEQKKFCNTIVWIVTWICTNVLRGHFWQLNIWLYYYLLGKAWSIILCCSVIWNTVTSSVASARTLSFPFTPVCNWLSKWRCRRYRWIKMLPKLPLNLKDKLFLLCYYLEWFGGFVCLFMVLFLFVGLVVCTLCRQNTMLFV